MAKLFIFNFILIAIIALALWCVKKFARCERVQGIILICAALATVLFHYSSFFYHCFVGTGGEYLGENPNLILPIYPCNLVMWICVIFAFCRNKKSKTAAFLADYIFWFGLISALVGMFANVDFIRNPTLTDYEITKSIAAHATMLFNILLLPLFGFVKVEMIRNMRHIIMSILLMLVTGFYCNLVFWVLVSEEAEYDVNSMFLLHSPFDGADFLTYPVIALIAIPIYLLLFTVCEMFAYKKGERFYNRIYRRYKGK